MKRPRLSRGALAGMAGVCALFAAGCRPEVEVEPGAPVLMEMIIMQATPGAPTATTILADTPDCSGSTAAGGACDPAADLFCRIVTSSDWCSCAADAMDPAVGTWACPEFASVSGVIAVFDRLLDTTPLGPGIDDPGPEDIASASSAAGATVLATNYGSNGATPGTIFPFFGPVFFGNYRQNGPSLFAAPTTAFPSASAVTVTFNKTKVLAKDGSTTFESGGTLLDGILAFKTAPFTVTLLDPDPNSDPVAASAQFTNLVDADTVAMHTTVTANGTPVDVAITPNDRANLVIKPAPPAMAWPAGATIVITMDATTPNEAGETLGTAATHMFTAP